MIRCNVTLNGVISKPATMRSGNDSGSFIGFVVKTVILGKTGSKEIEIHVSSDGTDSDIARFVVGQRIGISGTLTFRKPKDTLYLNMKATSINFAPEAGNDGIEGIIDFYGSVGRQIEKKKDRKGNEYLTFSAYSSEKTGEAFSYIWVRFIRFSSEQETFLNAKSKIHVTGKLELSMYYDSLGISCQVDDIREWVYKSDSHRESTT